MQPRLTEIVASLEAQRAAALHAASALPHERWTTRPAPDRWSVSEILEHLYRVERGIAPLVSKRAAEARESGHPEETESASVIGTFVDRGVSDRRTKLDAPERVVPTECPEASTVLTRLASSRAALLEAVASADGLALESIRAVHPRLGEINLYEWIHFVGLHEARHVGQIEETVASVAAGAFSNASTSSSTSSATTS